MELPRDAVLLRVFFGEDDKFERLPLYEAIVLKAREMHLAGVTMLRGHVGFGHMSRIHTTKILRLSQDLPIVLEIVDTKEKVDTFLPVLDGMMSSGLVTHREGSGSAVRELLDRAAKNSGDYSIGRKPSLSSSAMSRSRSGLGVVSSFGP